MAVSTEHRAADPVVVHADGVRLERREPDIALTAVHREFGGVDGPAIVAGTLAALGTAVLLSGLIAALAAFVNELGFRPGPTATTVGAAVLWLLVAALAFFFGGWVAGRVARYDGGRNGLLTAVTFLVLTAVIAAASVILGRSMDPFGSIRLPDWLSGAGAIVAAVGVAVLVIALLLAAGWFGGRRGWKYHRDADALLLSVREGGVGATEEHTR